MLENDEMMLQETSEAEEIENDTLDEEKDVWEFEDDEAEENEARTEENPEENPENEEPAENTEQEETNPEEMFPGEFEVDGQARAVTMAEAPSLIQKGLLYGQLKDKYMGKLKDAYADPRIAFVDELAKAAGQDVSEYMSNARMHNEYAGLIEEYGTLESVPEAVMKLFSDNVQANKDKVAQALAERQQKQWEQQKAEEYEAFMENHPEVKEIPQDIVKLVHKGESLEGAWALTELPKALQKIAELEKQNKILEQNNKNTRSKMPSLQSTAKKDSGLEWEF